MKKNDKIKNNKFFNFKEKNIWDVGWPISPRLYFLFIFPTVLIITIISIILL